MPPSDGHQPVAAAVRGGGHAHDRLVEVNGTGGAEEGGVAEAEDAAVGGHKPVAAAVRRGRHAHDRLVEVSPAHGAEEAGIAVVEDAAVGRNQPVTVRARRVGHSHHRLVQAQGAGTPVEAGVPEVEDPPVGGDEAVPVPAVEIAAEAEVIGRRLRRHALRVGDGDVDAPGVRRVGRDDGDRRGRLRHDAAATHRPECHRGDVAETAPEDRDGTGAADRSQCRG